MDGESEALKQLPSKIPTQEANAQGTREEHYLNSVFDEVHIRGGEYAKSAVDQETKVQDGLSCPATKEEVELESWKGWAEIENDPEIFTILVQEWGARHICVEEVLDVSELPLNHPGAVFGLIFLSRYVAPDSENSSRPKDEGNLQQDAPWFANQISKFSCGTVSLMNILMNNNDFELSETLSKFRQDTRNLSAKDRGLYLDRHSTLRDIHNSFSTLLDRMIVDQMVKQDFQAAKTRSQATKRKRGKKGRKRQTTNTDEDDNGNHFVAYISTNTTVWRLDGLEAEPRRVGIVSEGMSWLDVASAALMQQIEEAIEANYEVSLMKVVRTEAQVSNDETAKLERRRKQEDWAPFIEHMLRLHAEKGDLAQLLEA